MYWNEKVNQLWNQKNNIVLFLKDIHENVNGSFF